MTYDNILRLSDDPDVNNVIRFLREPQYMEGRSWNHVFEIKKELYKGQPVWEIYCHRVTMGKTPDKQVYLDYMTLDFVQYLEK